MDFYGSEHSYVSENPSPDSYVDKKSFSKNVLGGLFAAELMHFFNQHWSLGINADYKYVPVKTSGFAIDSHYSYWAAGQEHHEALRVDIPGSTWNLGGFGFGVNFGLHF